MNFRELLLWAVPASIVMLVGGAILLPTVIVLLPADYFVRPHQRLGFLNGRHPVVRLTLLGIKNLVGGLLVLAGVIMLVTPGQGLLSILVGLSLVDLPGKQRFILALLGRPGISRAMNGLRARANRPPLIL